MEGVFGSPATPVMAPPPASVQHRRVMENSCQEQIEDWTIRRYLVIFFTFKIGFLGKKVGIFFYIIGVTVKQTFSFEKCTA